MRVLVIGGRGQLASCLRERADEGWSFVSRDVLDLAQLGEFSGILDGLQPEAIINAAAYTAVDRAETEPQIAFAVNEAAPAALAHWCKANRASFIHISTDYVFDGSGAHAWREEDEPHPLNVYGASKLAGERAVVASGAKVLVLRTSWVHSPYGNNFVRTMLRLAIERDQLSIVDDQRGAPTSAHDLADAIAALLPLVQEERISGLYHCASAGATSWAGFAQAIFEGGLARRLITRIPLIRPIGSSDYPTAARRPLNSILASQRLVAQSGIGLPGWRLGLQRTLDALAAAKEKTS